MSDSSATQTVGKPHFLMPLPGRTSKVANWPGVTVEKKEGYTTYEGEQFKLVDLPGIYSLTSYTMEEKVYTRMHHER